MRLYAITDEIRAILDAIEEADGEITAELAERLDRADLDLEGKVDACCARVAELKATAAALKAEEQRLAKRRKTTENEARSIRDYVAHCLSSAGRDRVAGPRFSARVGLSRGSVTVHSLEDLPGAYKSLSEPAWEVDKRLLRAALDAGDVPGAEVTGRKVTLTIT